MHKFQIKEVKDVNEKLTGYRLEDLVYYLAPLEKTQVVNLNKQSQICLTIDDKDTEVTISEIFLSIHSIQGDTIEGYSFLSLIDTKGDIIINDVTTNVKFYDKNTGVHFKIRNIDTPIVMDYDKKITVEDMLKYASILDKGKVTAANEVIEGKGESVEDLLKKAEEEKEIADKKKREDEEAEEKRLESIRIAAEEKVAADKKKQEEEEDALRIQNKLAQDKKEKEEQEAIAAKKVADDEAKRIADEEAKKISDAKEQGRLEAIRNQLGGQDYIDNQSKHAQEGYEEFDKGAYRFFFKNDESPLFFYKLVKGGIIPLDEAIDSAEEDPDTKESFYKFTEDGERKVLSFDPKEKEITVKKSAVEA